MAVVVQFVSGAIVILVAVQLLLVVSSSFRRIFHDREQGRLSLQLYRQRIEAAKAQRAQQEHSAQYWKAYRKFVVRKKVSEADGICSFYLAPHDGKPLPRFEPGQFLSFSLNLPDRDKPLVRSYSLSDCARPDGYRVTIKLVPPPRDEPSAPPGQSSTYFHECVNEGDILDVTAPKGHFTLDPMIRKPAVAVPP